MKKPIFVSLSLLLSTQGFAAGAYPILEVSFKNASKHHNFVLTSEKNESVFKLVFEGKAKGQKKTKLLSKFQANYLSNEATRIIWNAKYRSPSSSAQCTKYASIRSRLEKTDVCLENPKATAMAYGLLNSISQFLSH